MFDLPGVSDDCSNRLSAIFYYVFPCCPRVLAHGGGAVCDKCNTSPMSNTADHVKFAIMGTLNMISSIRHLTGFHIV